MLFLLNIIMKIYMAPYIQDAVSRHQAFGDHAIIWTVLVTLILSITGLYRLYKNRSSAVGYCVLLIGFNLVYWINLLSQFECTQCSTG